MLESEYSDDLAYSYWTGIGLTLAAPVLDVANASPFYDWVKVEYLPSGFGAGVGIVTVFTDLNESNSSVEMIYVGVPVTRYYRLNTSHGLGVSLRFTAVGLPAGHTIYCYLTLMKGIDRVVQ